MYSATAVPEVGAPPQWKPAGGPMTSAALSPVHLPVCEKKAFLQWCLGTSQAGCFLIWNLYGSLTALPERKTDKHIYGKIRNWFLKIIWNCVFLHIEFWRQ